MAYNPGNITKGFLGGIEKAQTEQMRGLNIDLIRKEMKAKEAQERKRKQISGLLEQFTRGDKGAEQGLLGLGREGIEAAQTGATYLQGQQQAQQQQATAQQEEAAKKLVNALPYAFNVTDEQEWRTQAFPYVADAFVQAGGDPELVRRLDAMPMEQAKQVMQQMFQETQPKTLAKPVYETWVNTATSEKRTFDKSNMTEEDTAFMSDQANLEKTPTRNITGTPADFSSDKIADEMAKTEAATRNFIADIYEAQDFIKQNPGALTTVAGMARVATNISANLTALRSSFGSEFDSENIMDVENYTGTFKEFGIASAEMQSIMIGLGMQQAIINNPDGRISEKDVKYAMEQIGTSIQTPEGFIKVSSRLAARASRVFKTRYKARSKGGKEFTGDLGTRKSAKGKDISAMSLDELRNIDRGQMSAEEGKQAFDRWEELKGGE